MPEMSEEQRRELEEKLKNMSPEELKEFQKQQCIFCQIIAGKVPSKKVYEDEKCIAIMDINPAAIGHVLLLPKEHYAVMPQIPEEEVGHMFMVAKHLSQAMLRKLKVEGTNIFVANGMAAGQKTQHFMIHVIPRKEGDGILEIPKHLVDEPLRDRLKEIVEKKANELFGIKKEEKVDKEKKEIPPTRPQPSAEESKEEVEDKENGSEEKEEEEKKETKKAAKKKGKSEEKDEVGGETDLDDIAGLFK